MFGRPTRWTTETDESIRKLVTQGASVTRVAAALNENSGHEARPRYWLSVSSISVWSKERVFERYLVVEFK
jgi:hypothetical protein